ncbi:MAG TPA: hypothetical protein VE861_12730, partial [Gemmatimonadaceae bacterium]|nr:hypothetical protein [Gemmatimonadaceae bacterium]
SSSDGIDLTTGGAIASAVQTPRGKPLTAAQRKAAEDAATQRKKALDEARKMLEELAAAADVAIEGVAVTTRRAIATTIAELRARLAKDGVTSELRTEGERAIATYSALQGELLDAQQDAKTTAEVIAQADQESQERGLYRISIREQDLVAKQAETKTLEAQALLEKQLVDLAKKRAELTGDPFELPDSIEEARKESDGLATSIFLAVDGAIALADAFGGVTNETRRALTNLSLIGRSFTEIKKFQKDATAQINANPFDLGSELLNPKAFALAASAATSIVSAISSIGDAYDERKDEQRRNTNALRDLTLKIGDLASSTLSGDSLVKIQRVINDPQRFIDSQSGIISIKDQPAEIARQAGVTLAEVQSLLDEFGITFDRDLGAILTFSQALKKAELDAYVNTVAGSLQRFQDTLTADGVTDPLEILTRRIATLTSGKTGFPALAKALEGLDTSTVEGRATALERARALFQEVQNGTLSLDQFGGFSINDARQQLLELITGLRESVTGGSTGTGGFNETRTITEVTGSRIAGLLSSGLTYLAQIAADVRGIASVLQVPNLPRIATVGIPAGIGGSASGGGITFAPGAIAVNITLPADVLRSASAGAVIDAGTRFGEAVGSSFIATVDQQLRDRELRQRLLSGNAVLTT